MTMQQVLTAVVVVLVGAFVIVVLTAGHPWLRIGLNLGALTWLGVEALRRR